MQETERHKQSDKITACVCAVGSVRLASASRTLGAVSSTKVPVAAAVCNNYAGGWALAKQQPHPQHTHPTHYTPVSVGGVTTHSRTTGSLAHPR